MTSSFRIAADGAGYGDGLIFMTGMPLGAASRETTTVAVTEEAWHALLLPNWTMRNPQTDHAEAWSRMEQSAGAKVDRDGLGLAEFGVTLTRADLLA